MVYIHAKNLGPKSDLVNTTNVSDAEHFSWTFRLSTESMVEDQYTVSVEMPDDMADDLIWGFIDSNSKYALNAHLAEFFDNDDFRKTWREQLSYSVNQLNKYDREYVYMPSVAYMAKDIEQNLDNHEYTIFELLDAVEFPRIAELLV